MRALVSTTKPESGSDEMEEALGRRLGRTNLKCPKWVESGHAPLALPKSGQALAQDRDRRPCVRNRSKRLPLSLHLDGSVRAGAAAEPGPQRGVKLHAEVAILC